MTYKTMNISIPEQMKTDIEEEVRTGKFASVSDFIRDLVRDYLEDKRIENLVLEGLRDKNVSPLTKQDFKDMKSELEEYLKSKNKQPA